MPSSLDDDVVQPTPITEPWIRTADPRDRLVDVRADDRWMIVVAHPDDETFGCGSVIAHAAAHGAHVSVLCATRGEAGEPSALVPADAHLADVREAELRTAAALLGVDHVTLLDHRDSGFDGRLEPRALCAVGHGALVDEIAEHVVDTAPTLVVTLDGSDGHRDHERIRDVVRDALSMIGESRSTPVPALYEHCVPNSLMRRWLDEMRSRRPDTAYLALDPRRLGRSDEDITDVVDVSAFLELRDAAIAAHRSQTSPFEGLSADLRRAFLCTDHLARVL